MVLSENEYIIMKLLWSEGRPLSRAEVLKGTPGRNWNPASVHLILNSMLSKGAIRITDENVRYGRTYEALLTEETYIAETLRRTLPGNADSEILRKTILAMIDGGSIHQDELKEMQKELVEKISSVPKKRGRKKKQDSENE